MIYSAVRQVEELKKWVQLSVLEELDSGWRLFSGEYLAPSSPIRPVAIKCWPMPRQSIRKHRQLNSKRYS
ncbi:hypothetical protein CJJ18_08550 [Candidatus Williamhamiltonella defendens]|uniref:Uncharacterized protein n=1 Tax=Candidatus Williamhamiltonella defendens TaxID=138072 RepID=A0AAC9VLE6_9ENTR|nr:hypothetical protein [Candidatus Hamiltonella defensa]ASV34015.1 hypothetical protein CJJ18_08550 [Candidatus Hamiltonella defensa]AWK16974.1 hypothetical protein CCS40_08370 [Candidatus Hamiltonella defensa]